MRVAEAFQAWRTSADVATGTARLYCRTARSLERHGITDLDALTRETFCRFQDARRAEGRRPATINNELNAIRTVLAWLVRREGAASVYAVLYAALSVRGTRLRRGRPSPRDHYNRELFTELLPLACEIAPWFGQLAFPLACFTGLRRNELRRVEREDADLERRLLWVRRKAVLGHAGEIKNGHERAVSLCADAVALIRERAPESGPLFPAVSPRARTAFISEDLFRWAMRELALRSGKRCTWHRARRTFATWAILAEVPLEEISRALGHADVQVTQRCYIEWLTRYVPAFERLSFGA